MLAIVMEGGSKSRVVDLHPLNKSRQLGTIRGLSNRHFAYLVRAAQIPFEVVKKLVRRQEYVNGERFLLVDKVWDQAEAGLICFRKY